MLSSIIEQTFRKEQARVLAGLFRLTRDLGMAEDALQEAYIKALEVWSVQGLPDNPGAWITTVSKRRALDAMRAARRRPADALEEDHADSVESAAPLEEPVKATTTDPRLDLLLACCSSTLPEKSRAALALRAFLGLTTREIARAFLEQEKTTAQRLVRSKKLLRAEQRAAQKVPAPDVEANLGTVLSTLYLLFNEGYLATEGDALVRGQLCEQALGLTELLVDLCPNHAEARGLLALMLFHQARAPARVDAEGALVRLDQQDRSLWDTRAVERGDLVLRQAIGMGAIGPYQLQAAIAGLHAQATHASLTDWPQIAALYAKLWELVPTTVVELNAAVALSFATGPGAALMWVNSIEKRAPIKDDHLLAAVKADLLARLGHLSQANRYYRRARRLCRNAAEAKFLDHRVLETEPGGS